MNRRNMYRGLPEEKIRQVISLFIGENNNTVKRISLQVGLNKHKVSKIIDDHIQTSKAKNIEVVFETV